MCLTVSIVIFKGMYPSGNVVLFVNLDDIFDEVYKLLQKHPVYLCVSYDTDLLAVENIFGYTKRWVDFAERHTDLKIEIRNKKFMWKIFKRNCSIRQYYICIYDVT